MSDTALEEIVAEFTFRLRRKRGRRPRYRVQVWMDDGPEGGWRFCCVDTDAALMVPRRYMGLWGTDILVEELPEGRGVRVRYTGYAREVAREHLLHLIASRGLPGNSKVPALVLECLEHMGSATPLSTILYEASQYIPPPRYARVMRALCVGWRGGGV